jgi:hypothetical protein
LDCLCLDAEECPDSDWFELKSIAYQIGFEFGPYLEFLLLVLVTSGLKLQFSNAKFICMVLKVVEVVVCAWKMVCAE